jgi:antitoxin ParD1/3/4
MATRNVNLTESLDRFVEGEVASVEFQNASEVVRAGLRLLKAEREDRQARIDRLNAAIEVGADQLDCGEDIEIDAWRLTSTTLRRCWRYAPGEAA